MDYWTRLSFVYGVLNKTSFCVWSTEREFTMSVEYWTIHPSVCRLLSKTSFFVRINEKYFYGLLNKTFVCEWIAEQDFLLYVDYWTRFPFVCVLLKKNSLHYWTILPSVCYLTMKLLTWTFQGVRWLLLGNSKAQQLFDLKTGQPKFFKLKQQNLFFI